MGVVRTSEVNPAPRGFGATVKGGGCALHARVGSSLLAHLFVGRPGRSRRRISCISLRARSIFRMQVPLFYGLHFPRPSASGVELLARAGRPVASTPSNSWRHACPAARPTATWPTWSRPGKMIDATPTAAFAEAMRRYLRPGGHRGRTGACSGPLRPALARLGPGGSGLLLLGD